MSFLDVYFVDYFVVIVLFLSVGFDARVARARAIARYRGGHAVDQFAAVGGTAPAKE